MSNADDEMSTPDRALLRALAEALGEQPPTDLTERCEGLLGWIDVDAELAELLDETAAVGVRGSGRSGTTMEFTIADRTCVIELVLSTRKLSGHLLGARAPLATARTADGATATASIDEHGGFELLDPPSGTIRIELDLEDGRRIRTDWFVI